MPTLLLGFPARRYHATPWGHHVNEGLVEWPPSPWRLLRALLATGYAAHAWRGNLDDPLASSPPPLARSLIGKLAAVLPRYRLPPASGAHSRHFMPTAVLDKKRGVEKTTLVFDTFAQVEDGTLAVIWDVALDVAETALLSALVESLGYLGRSESWVEARVGDAADALPDGADCVPCADLPQPGPGWEQVALLTMVSAADFAAWRARAIDQVLLPMPLPDKKPSAKLLAARAKAQAPFPPDLIACLQADTIWLRGHGWSQPPGSQRVLYWRRADALAPGVFNAPPETPATAQPFVLLALAAQHHNNHVLPLNSRTLAQAELLHRAVVRVHQKLGHDHSPVLTGCDTQGRPLAGAHRHAHTLPLDLDGDGHLDHVLIWAPDTLDAAAQQTLAAVRATYAKGVTGSLRLALAAVGGVDEMTHLHAPYGEAIERTLGKGACWVSDTPFVPPRHLKARGHNSLHGQICAELRSRGLPEPDATEHLAPQTDELARGQGARALGREGSFPIEAVVHIDVAALLVGAHGDATAHVGHDDVDALIESLVLLGVAAGRGDLIEGMADHAAGHFLEAGDFHLGIGLVHHEPCITHHTRPLC